VVVPGGVQGLDPRGGLASHDVVRPQQYQLEGNPRADAGIERLDGGRHIRSANDNQDRVGLAQAQSRPG
jgi:hypothetical protein